MNASKKIKEAKANLDQTVKAMIARKASLADVTEARNALEAAETAQRNSIVNVKYFRS